MDIRYVAWAGYGLAETTVSGTEIDCSRYQKPPFLESGLEGDLKITIKEFIPSIKVEQ